MVARLKSRLRSVERRSGTAGPAGPAGAAGAAGQGVPVGGTTGQALTKINATDYNTQWSDTTVTLTGDVTGTGTGSIATAIGAGVIVNADINASAGIALSKLASDPLARANHTGSQTASTISDFNEAVDDRAADLLVGGTNITLTYNDAANTLTINSTGGGVSDGDKGDIVVSGGGTVWSIDAGVIVDADISASAAIANSKLATDPLARANHTGTQTASTISDFAAAVAAEIPTSTVTMTSDAASNSTTTGVEITALQKTLVAGTYVFRYYIRYFAGATTTGVSFGINYTGTQTVLVTRRSDVGTGTTAVSGTSDQSNTAAQIVEGYSARVASTTAPNLGPSLGVDSASSSMLTVIEGLIVTTGGGDLELWHASEVAATSTVKSGSTLIITKVA